MARAIINAIFASSIMLLAPTASMAQSSFGNLLESGESSFQDFVRDNQKWLEQERKDEIARARAREAARAARQTFPDYYNACLGMTEYPTNCYNVDDPDMKNLCLANSGQGYETMCYNIRNEDIKNLCLANAYRDYRTMCYSIGSSQIKDTCLAASDSDYRTNCYNINSEPWRSLCAGLALAPTNCYNLN
ncbi:MAG: hypothetical protein KC439_10355 [Yoonia sp.]|nr:hypothetical protein [Yoonia sp.]